MIYDCFMFFNELDVLEIRLNELSDVVDYFVLVESTVTHQGGPKPLYFKENIHRYAKFLHKIIHIVVDDMPATDDTWVREGFQRNCIARGLVNCKPDDVIIVSDADEIPKASVVKNYDIKLGLTCIQTDLFYYKLNYLCAVKWFKVRIFPFSELRGGDVQQVRGSRDYDYKSMITNGGWHFSFLGDKEHIRKKIESWGHIEFNNEFIKSDENIERAINSGKDIFGRSEVEFDTIPITSYFPKFVVENQDMFASRGLIAQVKKDKIQINQILRQEDENVYNEIYKLDVYGMKAEDFDNSNIIDIGSYYGHFAFRAIELGAKRIFCFEPQKHNFDKLQILKAQFDRENQISIHNVAVFDDTKSTVSISNNSCASSIYSTENTHPIDVISLRSICNKYLNEHEKNILKLDCEGSEFEIILNTPVEQLRKFQYIFIEIHKDPNPAYRNRSDWEVVLEQYLISCGYSVDYRGPKAGWYSNEGEFTTFAFTLKLKRIENFDILPDGWFGDGDIAVYNKIIRDIKLNGKFAEIGVWQGRSLCSVSKLVKQNNLHVIAVDTFAGNKGEQEHQKILASTNVSEKFASNIGKFGIAENVKICIMASEQASKNVPDESLDLVFIDADHSYEAVKLDIESWLPKVKNGGCIAGHDYMYSDNVRRAVHEFFGNNVVVEANIWYVKNIKKNTKKYTVGYINSNNQIFAKYLKPCLERLDPNIFDVISVDAGLSGATIYNQIMLQAKTKYIIFLHQDVAFGSDFLEAVDSSINKHPDFGALGIVGFDQHRNTIWANDQDMHEVDFFDSMCLVVNRDHKIKFDDLNFNELHLYVEDYCMQAKSIGLKCYTIQYPSFQFDGDDNFDFDKRYFKHIGVTYKKNNNTMWGKYDEYGAKFNRKWFATNNQDILHAPNENSNKKIEISIVIPTYNHLEDCLKPCVDSIIRNTDLSSVEVIIVANGCVDNTKSYVESLGEPFKLVWIDQAAGYAKATNAGIRAAKGEYILLLNNDTIILDIQNKNDWILLLKQPFELQNNVGISGPLKGFCPYYDCDEAVGHAFMIFFCCMMRKQLFDEIGLLDEDFGVGGGEDTAFCWKTLDAGYELVQVPMEGNLFTGTKYASGTFPIFHNAGATRGEDFVLLRKNNLKLIQKFRTKNLRLHYTHSHAASGHINVSNKNPVAALDISPENTQLADESVTAIIFETEYPFSSLEKIISECQRILVNNGSLKLYINENEIEYVKALLGKYNFDTAEIMKIENKFALIANKTKKYIPKIYDCFAFFNELDILEIRLNELYDYVDYFVLVEMTVTHQGKTKPLYYADNTARFAKFKDKILHVVVSDCLTTDDPWIREHFQRNCISRALTRCDTRDIIIVSDVDEIPKGSKIARFDPNLPWMYFEQTQHNFYLNCMSKQLPAAPGVFSRIITYGNMVENNLNATDVRYRAINDSQKISDGGWHFTWIGGVNKIVEKLEAFAHQEINLDEYKNTKKIQSNIDNNIDVFGRSCDKISKFIEIDDSFPQYIRNNVDMYIKNGFIKIQFTEPLVAIIMPYYNDHKHLIKSIDAIHQQSYKNWHLYVIDDGSSQEQKAKNILRKYYDKVTIVEKKNGGPSSARNLGLNIIKSTDAKYVAYCDSDDIWPHNYLTSQISNLHNCDVSYCSADSYFEDGSVAIPFGIADPEEYPGYEFMLRDPFVYISGVVHDVKCLSIGDFDSQLDSIEDWDFWLRMAESGYKFVKNKNVKIIYTAKINNTMSAKRNDEINRKFRAKHYNKKSVALI